MNEPAWLTALIDQRMALIEDKGRAIPPGILITTPLVENMPDTKQGVNLWDLTCDNPGCQKYCPKGLYSGTIARTTKQGNQVLMIFGVCPACYTQLEP